MPTPSFSSNFLPSFSHIYVETKALNHPKTVEILARFKQSTIIEILHYKDLFNQKNSHFRAQKQSPKLILAFKEAPFLYEGSTYADGFGFERFFYTPTMLNCLYDCDYCYLQGLYQSAHMVVYVNREDFMHATVAHLDKPTLVCTSYDTDLLAVENLIGENRDWILFAQKHPHLHIEIRTKSANFASIRDLPASPQVVLAWTLSPQSVIDAYEHKTPALAKRLASIKEALSLGWQVRLCLDPVIDIFDAHHHYGAMIEEIFSVVDASKVFEVTLGTFRLSSAHLRSIKKMQHTPLAFYPYEVRNHMALYPSHVETNLIEGLSRVLLQHIDASRLRVWRNS